MGKWIPLPVEFKGIWYNTRSGDFFVRLSDRFNPQLPPDRFHELLMKENPELAKDREPHEGAKPHWESRESFEEKYGRVEAILVDEWAWNNEKWMYTPNEYVLLIFTNKYVITMREYDGVEYFIALPRDYKELLVKDVG
jgi:hypothetical protein